MWYHHKWGVILVVFLIILLTFALVQSLGKESPDVHMLYVGPSVYTGRHFEQPDKEIQDLFSDNNNDGKKLISYIGITAYTESNSGTIVDAKYMEESLRSFQTQAVYGEAFVFIVDVEFYNKLKDELNILADLSSIIDKDDIPPAAIDNKGIHLKDIDISEMVGFSDFPRESILCFRCSPELTQLNYGRTVEMYEQNLEFFRNILKYRKEPAVSYRTIPVVSSGSRVLNVYGINKLDDTFYYLGKLTDGNMSLQADYHGYSNRVTTDKDTGELKYDEKNTSDTVDKIIERRAQIAIVDRAVFTQLFVKGMLEKVDEISAKASAYKKDLEYGLYLKDIPAYMMNGFCFLELASDDDNTMIVCFIKKTGQTEDEDLLAKKIFKRMLNDAE